MRYNFVEAEARNLTKSVIIFPENVPQAIVEDASLRFLRSSRQAMGIGYHIILHFHFLSGPLFHKSPFVRHCTKSPPAQLLHINVDLLFCCRNRINTTFSDRVATLHKQTNVQMEEGVTTSQGSLIPSFAEGLALWISSARSSFRFEGSNEIGRLLGPEWSETKLILLEGLARLLVDNPAAQDVASHKAFKLVKALSAVMEQPSMQLKNVAVSTNTNLSTSEIMSSHVDAAGWAAMALSQLAMRSPDVASQVAETPGVTDAIVELLKVDVTPTIRRRASSPLRRVSIGSEGTSASPPAGTSPDARGSSPLRSILSGAKSRTGGPGADRNSLCIDARDSAALLVNNLAAIGGEEAAKVLTSNASLVTVLLENLSIHRSVLE